MKTKNPKWQLQIEEYLFGTWGWELHYKKNRLGMITDNIEYKTWRLAYNAGLRIVRGIAEGVDVETCKKERIKT